MEKYQARVSMLNISLSWQIGDGYSVDLWKDHRIPEHSSELLMPLKSKWSKARANGYANMVAYALSVAENNEVELPVTCKEAIKSMESAQWIIAWNEEMKSLYKNQTWGLVKLPMDLKIFGCKWVYKKKKGIPRTKDARYTARLVAKGFTQREFIDYNEIFSPIVKHTSIRVLLAMVALYDLELNQLDVKIVVLHNELEEQIFMRQLERFVIQDKEDHATPQAIVALSITEAEYIAATEAMKEVVVDGGMGHFLLVSVGRWQSHNDD
ncbi:hypothetical protein RJ639_017078 [Escallonia herrerae]|uniref:Reverse transcriptase Ty1/copia-type domain-containing protein n=1 Tax=Escallonia herrerae TaxID=1293975 RepID=A0AA88VCX9_9ASTE|nr:hypothetical protein RJ639_017078 [Escallonia herrerae]